MADRKQRLATRIQHIILIIGKVPIREHNLGMCQQWAPQY